MHYKTNISKPGYIVSVYYVFAGIIILLNGISNLSVACHMKKAGFDRWAAAVILSVIAIIAGIEITEPLLSEGRTEVLLSCVLFSIAQRSDACYPLELFGEIAGVAHAGFGGNFLNG